MPCKRKPYARDYLPEKQFVWYRVNGDLEQVLKNFCWKEYIDNISTRVFRTACKTRRAKCDVILTS